MKPKPKKLTRAVFSALSLLVVSAIPARACPGSLHLLLGNDTGGYIQNIDVVDDNGAHLFPPETLEGGEGKWLDVSVTAGAHYRMTARDDANDINYTLDFYPTQQDGLIDFMNPAFYDEWGGDISSSSSTITTGRSPSGGGTVTGGGTVSCGSSVTVIANPGSCYTFVNWTEYTVPVSSSSNYTFTASASRYLVANFAVRTYTITTSSSPSNGGSTSGGGTKNCGSTATVCASPASCYRFVNWTEGTNVVSTNACYPFTVSGNRTLVAHFALITYTIATSSSPSNGGTTGGDGAYNCGSSVTVCATSNPCFTFVNWTEGGVAVSTSSCFTFTAAANRTLVAHFTPITYTISLNCYPTNNYPANWGTISGGGAFTCGSSVTVTATPISGFTFVCWAEGQIPLAPWSNFITGDPNLLPGFIFGTKVSTDSHYQFTVDRDRTLTAHFARTCAGTVELLVADFDAVTSFQISGPNVGPNDSFTWSAPPGGNLGPLGTSVIVGAIPGQRYTYTDYIDGVERVHSDYYPLTDDAYLDLTGDNDAIPYYEHENEICTP